MAMLVTCASRVIRRSVRCAPDPAQPVDRPPARRHVGEPSRSQACRGSRRAEPERGPEGQGQQGGDGERDGVDGEGQRRPRRRRGLRRAGHRRGHRLPPYPPVAGRWRRPAASGGTRAGSTANAAASKRVPEGGEQERAAGQHADVTSAGGDQHGESADQGSPEPRRPRPSSAAGPSGPRTRRRAGRRAAAAAGRDHHRRDDPGVAGHRRGEQGQCRGTQRVPEPGHHRRGPQSTVRAVRAPRTDRSRRSWFRSSVRTLL